MVKSTTSDLFRFVFASSVFLSHWYGTYNTELSQNIIVTIIATANNKMALGPAHYGVIGFIVVSGFCIRLTQSIEFNFRSIFAFTARRLVRVVPVIIAASFVWWLLVLRDFAVLGSILKPSIIVANNAPLITVFIELLLYGSFIPLSLLIRSSSVTGWMVVGGLSLLGLFAPYSAISKMHFPFDLQFHSLLAYFPYWWAGVVAAEIYKRNSLKLNHIQILPVLFFPILLSFLFHQNTLFFSAFSISQQLFSHLFNLFFAISVALALATYNNPRLFEFGEKSSSASYTLYAIHTPILTASLLHHLPAFISAMIVCFLTALVYFVVERPSHKLAKKIGRYIITK